MRMFWGFAAVALGLAACGLAAGPATATPAATQPPTPAPSATARPTTLAEGVQIRLGTPDPSPECPEHYPWFFDNRARECASFAANIWVVMQHFERGLMVWFQEHGETFILIDDGSSFKPYSEAADLTGVASPPGPDPALAPPAGLYQPVLGFAKFWRGLAPGYDWVRPALGWATAPEEGYSSFYQCNTALAEGARCYLSGPAEEILVLARGPARYWTYVKVPRSR